LVYSLCLWRTKNCSRSYPLIDTTISKSKKLPKYGKIFLDGNIKAIESISDANFAFESRKSKKQLE
jgi:hypothetical protein